MASKGINKVILVGNLGQNPEIKVFQNGNSVANITIATSETWKDKNTGEQREKTEWHRVSMFNKLADIAGQYLKKGSKVYIEGSLKTRKWQDNTGAERYVTEVHASTLQMLGGSSGGSNTASQDVNGHYTAAPVNSFNAAGSAHEMANTAANTNSLNNTASVPTTGNKPFPGSNIPDIDFDDDIPF